MIPDSVSSDNPSITGKKWLRFGLIVICLGVVVGGVVIAIMIWLNTGRLPGSVVRRVTGFTVYYPKPGFTTDFKLVPQSVSYSGSVLVFSMKNSIGKAITFSEEATTKQFGPADLAGMPEVNTEFGQSYISDSGNTIGTLFTDDNTWVVLNAPTSIGATLMQQFLQALAPVKQ